MQTGWITATELGLMWTSSQNAGAGRPYPYTRVAILNPSTLAVISQPDIWNSQYAWLYPAVSVNERGHLGGSLDAMGGTLFPTIRALPDPGRPFARRDHQRLGDDQRVSEHPWHGRAVGGLQRSHDP
jgi:hypothetical protein